MARHSGVSNARAWATIARQLFGVGTGLALSWTFVLVIGALPATAVGGICFLLLNDFSGDPLISGIAGFVAFAASIWFVLRWILQSSLGTHLRL